ncbi:hypothetical protein COBT_001753 [Conglomerata obtusa]
MNKDPLPNLATIKHLITHSAIPTAVSLINPHIASLAPHLQPYLSVLEAYENPPLLCLSMLHFTLKNYNKSISYFLMHYEAMQNETQLKDNLSNHERNNALNLKTNGNHYNSNENLDKNKNDYNEQFTATTHTQSQNYLELLKSTKLCGYDSSFSSTFFEFFYHNIVIRMLEVKEPSLVLKSFIYSQTHNDPLIFSYVMRSDRSVIRNLITRFGVSLCVLQRLAEEENCFNEFYALVKEMDVFGRDCRVKVDAFVYFDDKIGMKRFICELVKDVLLCYEICFYVNECYSLFFDARDVNDIVNSLENNIQNIELKKSVNESCNNEVCNKNIDFGNNVSSIKKNIKKLLSGELKRNLILKLTAKHNKTDFPFLQTMIKPLTRASSSHTGIVFSNAIMNLGSSNDTFHRINVDLLNQTRHWNKFFGMSCLGMIHVGNDNTLEILKNILPNENEVSEGGSLLSIGLMECFKKENEPTISSYLLNFIESTDNNTIKSQTLLYGACLGLGLVHFGKYDKEIIDVLSKVLLTDNVLGAEASAYAIGMNMICTKFDEAFLQSLIDINEINIEVSSTFSGVNNVNDVTSVNDEGVNSTNNINTSNGNTSNGSTSNINHSNVNTNNINTNSITSNNMYDIMNDPIHETINDLLGLSEVSTHEKISRACGVSISLFLIQSKKIGKIIKKLMRSSNEILRYSSSFCIGSSFVGTCDLKAISLLLSQLNDVSEDVKRGCVISLGFVCCNKTETLFSVLEPLTVNHSAGVRGAAALTLGFFLSGTGDSKCINAIEVLMYDSDPLVRQSACIGMGFILAQCTEKNVSNFKRIVERLNLLIVEKAENNCTATGAVIGRSLMEGGGRNIIYGVNNMYGKTDKTKVAGAILFMQYWYSYSMISFITLCTLPTFYVVLNQDLDLEKSEIEIYGMKEKYDVNAIKIPEMKTRRKRRLRRRYRVAVKTEVKSEIVEESKDENYVIKSGERLSVFEKRSAGIKDYGFIFR